MRVFVAGASGPIGRRLLPPLVRAGHAVAAMTRSVAKTAAIRAAGAVPMVADALNEATVMTVVQSAEPEVVVHQLTAIPPRFNFRRFDREFALTNRLRIEGTDHLVAAARAVGARRFVAQSFAGWPYARDGGPVKAEADPLDSNPPPALRRSLEAIRYLEATVLETGGLEGLVLRYGAFYGPGSYSR
jgi:nucleoside-diphosphate-sugar epimerase